MFCKQVVTLILLLAVSTVVTGLQKAGEPARRIRSLRRLQNDTDTTFGDSLGGSEFPASSLPGGDNVTTVTETEAPTQGNGLNIESSVPGGLDAVTSSPTPAPVVGGLSPTFGSISTPSPGPFNETSPPEDGNVVGSPTPIGAGTNAPTAFEATTNTNPPTVAPFFGPTDPTFAGEPTGPTFAGEPTGPTFVGEPTEPHIYKPPTEPPTAEYVPPPPSAGDPVEQEQEEEKEQDADWGEGKETLEELERDQRVLIALGVIGGIALLLLICTAHQMLENPDGCCAR